MRWYGPRILPAMTVAPGRASTILAIALVALGCQASPTAPSTSGSATAAPATAAPSTGASSVLPALELPDINTVVTAAGRYTFSDFVPRVTLELDANTWRLGPKIEGFFAVVRSAGGESAVIVRFVRPTAVFNGPDTTVAATTAAASVAALKGNSALVDKGTSESRLGGLSGGLVIEIESANAATTPKFLLRGPVSFTVETGTRLWLAFFDLPDGLLNVQVLGSSANWERDLGLVEPTLESVTIGQ